MTMVDLTYISKKGIRTKKLNWFKGIGAEKEFEMSVIELGDFGYIIACIYRSPDSKFWTFFKTLELTIQIEQAKRKKLLMCGDWNLKFMSYNISIQEIQNLLENYNKYSKSYAYWTVHHLDI